MTFPCHKDGTGCLTILHSHAHHLPLDSYLPQFSAWFPLFLVEPARATPSSCPPPPPPSFLFPTDVRLPGSYIALCRSYRWLDYPSPIPFIHGCRAPTHTTPTHGPYRIPMDCRCYLFAHITPTAIYRPIAFATVPTPTFIARIIVMSLFYPWFLFFYLPHTLHSAYLGWTCTFTHTYIYLLHTFVYLDSHTHHLPHTQEPHTFPLWTTWVTLHTWTPRITLPHPGTPHIHPFTFYMPPHTPQLHLVKLPSHGCAFNTLPTYLHLPACATLDCPLQLPPPDVLVGYAFTTYIATDTVTHLPLVWILPHTSPTPPPPYPFPPTHLVVGCSPFTLVPYRASLVPILGHGHTRRLPF